MANINLSTGQTTQPNNPVQSANKYGLISSISILVIALGAVGALLLWKNDIEKKEVAAKTAYDEKYKELTSGKNKEVVDLQNRIFLAEDLVEQSKSPVAFNVLRAVEDSLVAGVYIDSYSQDKTAGSLKLSCVTDSYDSVARQVLSFKNSDVFSDVTVGKMDLSSEGKINFLLDLKVK